MGIKVSKKANTKTQKSNSIFIGKAWKNIAQKGEHKGTEYLKMTIDREDKDHNPIELIEIKQTETLLFWPNNKREGKQDADYRVTLVSPVTA